MKHGHVTLFLLLAAALLLATAGCDTLPEGEPPEGDLTSNDQPPVRSPLALRNHLVTQLIMFALQEGLTSLDPGDDPETVAIAAEAARMAGFRLDRGSRLSLKMERSANGAADLVAVGKADRNEVWRSQRP